MIDVHCHLNFEAFENDYETIVKKALGKGVTKIINTGTQISSSKRAVELARKYEDLYAIVGVHPHHADKVTLLQQCHPGVATATIGSPTNQGDSIAPLQNDNSSTWLTQLESLTRHPKVIGIGECGLDFYSYKSNGIVDAKIQEEIFVRQIELSIKLKLPLQIHNRQAGKKVIEILRSFRNDLLEIPGMFHCFAADLDVLKSALRMGFYIGFDGNITYPGLAPGEDTLLSDLASYTPNDRIVTETDSPFLSPIPYRGGRNEPSHVIIVGQYLAKIKKISFEEIDELTTNNARTVFSI